MAIAHKILIAVYHVLKDGVTYHDLGKQYLDQRDKDRVVAGLVSRLRALGIEISWAPSLAAPDAS
jgi:transposase